MEVSCRSAVRHCNVKHLPKDVSGPTKSDTKLKGTIERFTHLHSSGPRHLIVQVKAGCPREDIQLVVEGLQGVEVLDLNIAVHASIGFMFDDALCGLLDLVGEL